MARGVTAMPVPDPVQALEDVNEEGLLPNPVKLRDMLFHAKLAADQSLELNRQFTEYQKHFGEALKLAKVILGKLA
jgi:hypothetical protein